MHHYCTYFDRNFLPQGLALYRSLERHDAEFTLSVLCFDVETYEVLTRLELPAMRLISLADFECGDDALVATKDGRTRVEYYWTCTPSLPLYLFRTQPEIDVLAYVDADLYFFSDPQRIYDEFADSSTLIIEHRYTEELSYLAEHSGIYNVGFMLFRRDMWGLGVLQWWRSRCIEWCYARVEDGRFGDQKYLDDWPLRFENVSVLQNVGAGLAPWNIHKYALECSQGRVLVSGEPLVFFHFHSFRRFARSLYRPALSAYKVTPNQLHMLFDPYVGQLDELDRMLKAAGFESPTSFYTILQGLAIRELTVKGHHQLMAATQRCTHAAYTGLRWLYLLTGLAARRRKRSLA